MKIRFYRWLLPLLVATGGGEVVAQNALQRAGSDIHYRIEGRAAFSDHATPLWLGANEYGLSGTDGNFGYLRGGIVRDTQSDSARNWRIGYGLELAAGYGLTGSHIIPAQAYAEVEWLRMRLSAGIKEREAAFKHPLLSSGSMTLGTNARPVPQVRFEVPDYLSITGRSNWAAIKGHVGYGVMTDGNWQEDYVNPGHHYAKKALYHSKAGYLRIGNEDRFPLVFEGGLEMVCQFGGTIYNPAGREGTYAEKLEMDHGLKAFWNALTGTGSDATDEAYANAAGNTVGSWLLSLSYKGKGWRLRAYYDHYFEDHSMMFLEYGWRDGLVGVEATLPDNPVCTSIVYEYLNTTYQSGPIYHDGNATIPDQISGVDNYYNHNLYQGWQHWGQPIGNPLISSPLYDADGTLNFKANRVKAHHIGLCGQPAEGWNYRLLTTFRRSWGTYALPFMDLRHSFSGLAEVSYRWRGKQKADFLNGWQITAAFAMDSGQLSGDNHGFSLKLTKTGLLR